MHLSKHARSQGQRRKTQSKVWAKVWAKVWECVRGKASIWNRSRYLPGVIPSLHLNVRTSVAMLPNPLRWATRASGRSVLSKSCFARSIRTSSRYRAGVIPVSERTARAIVCDPLQPGSARRSPTTTSSRRTVVILLWGSADDLERGRPPMFQDAITPNFPL